MLRMLFVACTLLAFACSDSKPAKKKKEKPTDVALTAGPVPVTLAKLDAKRLRPITSIKEFVIIDPKGALSVGAPKAGAPPWVGEPADRWHDRTGFLEYDLDSFGTLSRDSSATALILADATTPARLTLTSGIQAYGYKPVALAAGAANTAVLYQFGGEPWADWDKRADLTLRTDQLDKLAGQKPHTVLLQFTDATTTGELLEALTAVAETGAEQVRLHRMMGWGAIAPADIVWVRNAVADDDIITEGEPATVTIAEAKVDGKVKAESVGTAMSSASPRFRYCYEKSGAKKPGKLELSFDVAQDGSVANAAAKGINAAIESCVAGAIFDSHVPTDGVEGPAHATVPIGFGHGEEKAAAAAAAAAKNKVSGWWCWIHQDGSVGMCAREQDQCEAQLYGFNQTAESLHDVASTNECKQQKTAWETESSRPLPTQAMCKAARDKGETCRPLK
ncbi:MAG TPA: hypothetical protein VFV99_09475 [Kofleriaceae bacterium]|nr:hypothetical protein [Kofleriaceae bacterium]